jgi:hypothetical protein
MEQSPQETGCYNCPGTTPTRFLRQVVEDVYRGVDVAGIVDVV